MYFIDTHSHIYYDKYSDDIDEVIDKAFQNNVKKIICVGVDIDSSLKSIKLAEKYDNIFATTGYHPHESKEADSNYLKDLEELSKHKKVVAIGETGLDYFYGISDKKTQIKIFREQCALSKSLNLPIIVHNRDSDDDLLECLIKEKISHGVIHCFASNLNFAKKITDLGMKISFTGLITFAKELEDVVLNTPIEDMMIETDSPYLTPIPFRGKRNDPSMVKYVAQKIAEIKNISESEVGEITSQTAETFFGI